MKTSCPDWRRVGLTLLLLCCTWGRRGEGAGEGGCEGVERPCHAIVSQRDRACGCSLCQSSCQQQGVAWIQFSPTVNGFYLPQLPYSLRAGNRQLGDVILNSTSSENDVILVAELHSQEPVSQYVVSMEAYDVSANRLGFRDVITVHLPSPSSQKVWLNMTCRCDSAVMSVMDVTVTAMPDPAHPCRFTQATHTLTLQAGRQQPPSLLRVDYQPRQVSSEGGRFVWRPSLTVNRLTWGQVEVSPLSTPTCRVCSQQLEANSFVVPQREKECQVYFLSFTYFTTRQGHWLLLYYMLPKLNTTATATTTTTTTNSPTPSTNWVPSPPSSSSPHLLPTADNACPATGSLPPSPSPPPVTTTTTSTTTTTTTTTTTPPSQSSTVTSPKRLDLLTSSRTSPVTSAHLVTATTTTTTTTTPSPSPSPSSAHLHGGTTSAHSQLTGSSSRKNDVTSASSLAPGESDVKRDSEDPNGGESLSVTLPVTVAVAVTVAVVVVVVAGCVSVVCFCRRRQHKQQQLPSSPAGQDQGGISLADMASPPYAHGGSSAAAQASACVDLPDSPTPVCPLRAAACSPVQHSRHTAAPSPPFSPFSPRSPHGLNGHGPAASPRHHPHTSPPGGHYGGQHGTVVSHHPACPRHPATAATVTGHDYGRVSMYPRGQPQLPATTGRSYGGVSMYPRGYPPATQTGHNCEASVTCAGVPHLSADSSAVDRSDSFSSVSTVSSEDRSPAQLSVTAAAPGPPSNTLSPASHPGDASWSCGPRAACPGCRVVLVHCKRDGDRADQLQAWLQQEAGAVVTVTQLVIPQWEHLRQLRHWCCEEKEKVLVVVCMSPAFKQVLEQQSAASGRWKKFLCEDWGYGGAAFMSVQFIDEGVLEEEEEEEEGREFLSSVVWPEKMVEVSGWPCPDLHRLLRELLLLDHDPFSPPSLASADLPSSADLQDGLQHLNAAHDHW